MRVGGACTSCLKFITNFGSAKSYRAIVQGGGSTRPCALCMTTAVQSSLLAVPAPLVLLST
jgi:hypothetical protein